MLQSSLFKTLIAAVIIWIAGVILIRLEGDLVLVQGQSFVLGYLITALAGAPTVWVASKIMGLKLKSMMIPTLVIAALTLVLDGFVMGFFPEVYTSPDKILYLAPLFLWAFGWACLSAFVLGGSKIPAED